MKPAVVMGTKNVLMEMIVWFSWGSSAMEVDGHQLITYDSNYQFNTSIFQTIDLRGPFIFHPPSLFHPKPLVPM